MKMIRILLSIASAAVICTICGCSKSTEADMAALQGSWKGPQPGSANDALASLTLSGNSLVFYGPNTNIWYKGTFTVQNTSPKKMIVTITDCPSRNYVGKSLMAIYKFQDGALIIAANEPGKTQFPARFGGPGVAMIKLTKD